MKNKQICSPIQVIKRFLLLDWLYFFTPFVLCVVYSVLLFDFSSLQHLVNSFYDNAANLFVAVCLCITLPNVATLLYCQRKVLKDMPNDIILSAASSERYGGAGSGKTSSAVLQAAFEAEHMQSELTEQYYFIKSNYQRWLAENPRKVKDFYELEKSVIFWEQHPEYIPFLGSNVVMYDRNGRKSYYVDGEALEQKRWLPAMFILIDEAGNEVPQELYKERPAGVTMFFRYIRHFGFRASLLEQKIDGIYINVRSVLGTMCLAMSQDNKLLPYFLIDLLSCMKNIIRRLDPECGNSTKFYELKKRWFHRLGYFCDKLQSFSCKLGFRIWHQMLINCPSAKDVVPPQEVTIYCTNTLPLQYDEREFSQLYLPSVGNSVIGDFVTKESDAGKHILSRFYSEEKENELKRIKEECALVKAKNDLVVQKNKQELLRTIESKKATSKKNK